MAFTKYILEIVSLLSMKLTLKKVLPIAGAFVLYQFYKLYEFGNSIIYKPIGVGFKGLGTKDFILQIQMEILNPTNRSLKMRGLDGTISYDGKVLSSFSTDPFLIKKGRSTFTLNFKFDSEESRKTLQSLIASGSKMKPLQVELRKKIPYFTTTEKFNIDVVQEGLKFLGS